MEAISSFINAHAGLIIDTGKVVLALVMFLFSALSLLIVVNFVVLRRKLQAMELNAQQTGEEVIALFTQTRAGLKGLKNSLVTQSTEYDARQLLRSGGRLALLLLNKERSVITLGAFGFKLAGNALRYFLNRR